MTKAQSTTAPPARIKVLPGYVVKNGKQYLVRTRIPAALKALRQKQRAEQERNNGIFADKFLDDLLKTHCGHIAIMKGGKVSGIYPSHTEAHYAAERRYPSGVYSIHYIEEPVEYEFGMGPCIVVRSRAVR